MAMAVIAIAFLSWQTYVEMQLSYYISRVRINVKLLSPCCILGLGLSKEADRSYREARFG